MLLDPKIDRTVKVHTSIHDPMVVGVLFLQVLTRTIEKTEGEGKTVDPCLTTYITSRVCAISYV